MGCVAVTHRLVLSGSFPRFFQIVTSWICPDWMFQSFPSPRLLIYSAWGRKIPSYHVLPWGGSWRHWRLYTLFRKTYAVHSCSLFGRPLQLKERECKHKPTQLLKNASHSTLQTEQELLCYSVASVLCCKKELPIDTLCLYWLEWMQLSLAW